MKIEIKRSQNVKDGREEVEEGGLFSEQDMINMAVFWRCGHKMTQTILYGHACSLPETHVHFVMFIEILHLKKENEDKCEIYNKWRVRKIDKLQKKRTMDGNESGCKIKFTALSIYFVTTRSPKFSENISVELLNFVCSKLTDSVGCWIAKQSKAKRAEYCSCSILKSFVPLHAVVFRSTVHQFLNFCFLFHSSFIHPSLSSHVVSFHLCQFFFSLETR